MDLITLQGYVVVACPVLFSSFCSLARIALDSENVPFPRPGFFHIPVLLTVFGFLLLLWTLYMGGVLALLGLFMLFAAVLTTTVLASLGFFSAGPNTDRAALQYARAAFLSLLSLWLVALASTYVVWMFSHMS